MRRLPPPEVVRATEELVMSSQAIRNDDEVKVDRPKIQCVPSYMGGMGFEKYFKPQIISFGPFHWNKPYVRVGQRYKAMWTAMYLVDTNQHQQESYGALFDRINDQVNEVRDTINQYVLHDEVQDSVNQYVFDIHNWLQDIGMWIIDGCSIIQVLKSYDDPKHKLNINIDHLVRVHQDILLLENQVPFKLLKLICNDNVKLNRCLHNFLNIHGVMYTGNHDLVLDNRAEHDPIHLLDYLRRAILMETHHVSVQIVRIGGPFKRPIPQLIHNISMQLRKYRIGSIRELKNTGIRVKKRSPDDNIFEPIFNSDSATLQLRQLTVDGSTMLIFLNLIAYEMCPDFHNNFEITSYIVFLSSLIETPEDVKELRSCGVLINELASDKEVSDLFNRMDTLLVPATSTYTQIRDQMQEHFVSHRSKIKMLGWMGEAYSSFLRSPWTVIALLAATLGLTLTFIQTWFAIHPKGS